MSEICGKEIQIPGGTAVCTKSKGHHDLHENSMYPLAPVAAQPGLSEGQVRLDEANWWVGQLSATASIILTGDAQARLDKHRRLAASQASPKWQEALSAKDAPVSHATLPAEMKDRPLDWLKSQASPATQPALKGSPAASRTGEPFCSCEKPLAMAVQRCFNCYLPVRPATQPAAPQAPIEELLKMIDHWGQDCGDHCRNTCRMCKLVAQVAAIRTAALQLGRIRGKGETNDDEKYS